MEFILTTLALVALIGGIGLLVEAYRPHSDSSEESED